MSFIRIFISIIILLFSFAASAQTNLIEIRHTMIGDDKYQVTFVLDQQISYQVAPSENKIFIDFTNTEFAVKSISHRLDGRFLGAILKSNKVPDNLRMILELSDQTIFSKAYSTVHNEQLFLTIELINSKLKTAIVKPVSKPKKEIKKTTIMIDPGHGGIDKGAIGANLNVFEKDITLSYAKELKKELSKYPQYNVVMTRDQDTYLSKDQRKELARKMKADLFISIHADSNSDPNLHGASIYTLSKEALDQEKAALTELEDKKNILKNDKLLKHNKDIANVLIDMVYQDTQNASIKLAKITMESLSKQIEMLEQPHRSAELRVLKGVDIPAVLVELGYLSNKREEELLKKNTHKRIFMMALAQGIDRYINESKK
jgi:N-acetylmuramoyl-L-alanine amidase